MTDALAQLRRNVANYATTLWPASGRTDVVPVLTQLASQLDTRARADGAPVVALVDAGNHRSAASVLSAVADALNAPNVAARTAPRDVLEDALERLWRLTRSVTGEPLPPAQRPVVLLHDVDPLIGHQIFGQLRDRLWDRPTTWVVTCPSAGAAVMLTPPADAFFATVMRVNSP